MHLVQVGNEGAQVRALGTIAKSASALSGTHFPEIDPDGVVRDGLERRIQRYRLQRVAGKLMPGERVRTCLRNVQVGRDAVGIRRRRDRATYYEGLQTCGSVWMCPVCAAKISERRRVELVDALERWKARGGAVLLLTLTVPHYANHRAHELVDTVLDLVRAFWSGRGRASTLIPGYAGQVRALEVTHGRNGWHPHVHTLLFLEAGLEDLGAVAEALHARWSALVLASALGVPNEHALTLQDGSAAAAYAGKWGMPEELTKAHTKLAARSGCTPFQLLEAQLGGDDQAGRLFRDYARAFKGRRQLYWSRGLRAALGLGRERSDEEVAATVDALDELAALLSLEDWALIRRLELRAEVLEVARLDVAGIPLLLEAHRRALAGSSGPPSSSHCISAGLLL